jgi:site-specific DNA recombinase
MEAHMIRITQLDQQIRVLRRGIDRLIDSYAEGVIEKGEFEPRVTGLKARLARLQARLQTAAAQAEAERELSLVVVHLEDFAQRVCQGLDSLDWLGRREVVRALVRRIEIDREGIEIVFRIPPPNGPPTPDLGSHTDAVWQHCTVGGGENVRLDDALAPAVEGPGGHARFGQSVPVCRLPCAPHPPTGPCLMNSGPDGVIGVSA